MTTEAPPAPPAPAPTPDAPPAPPAPSTSEAKFTQDDVNRFLAESKRTTPPADYDELKAAAAELAELKKAGLSDLEKAQEAATAAEAKAAAAIEAANKKLLKASVIAAAKDAVDPDDVFALFLASEHKDAVTVGDDGSVTGVAEAVKALLEAKPHLVGKPSTTPTGAADGGPQGAPGPAQLAEADLKTMTPEAIVAAKAAGQLNTLLGITTP